MAPMPVMATRRMRYSAAFAAGGLRQQQPLHTLAHLADAAHLPHFFIGDADVELVLEREEDFHRIHGVDAQLLRNRCRW